MIRATVKPFIETLGRSSALGTSDEPPWCPSGTCAEPVEARAGLVRRRALPNAGGPEAAPGSLSFCDVSVFAEARGTFW